ncbi:hypothetical protein OTU49_003313, partial [Cherax quadricarinatus]
AEPRTMKAHLLLLCCFCWLPLASSVGTATTRQIVDVPCSKPCFEYNSIIDDCTYICNVPFAPTAPPGSDPATRPGTGPRPGTRPGTVPRPGTRPGTVPRPGTHRPRPGHIHPPSQGIRNPPPGFRWPQRG